MKGNEEISNLLAGVKRDIDSGFQALENIIRPSQEVGETPQVRSEKMDLCRTEEEDLLQILGSSCKFLREKIALLEGRNRYLEKQISEYITTNEVLRERLQSKRKRD